MWNFLPFSKNCIFMKLFFLFRTLEHGMIFYYSQHLSGLAMYEHGKPENLNIDYFPEFHDNGNS